ncbi:MAG: D-glycerate 3-kinase [Bermanella sp.]|jgi:D-glycerate 3-kinase
MKKAEAIIDKLIQNQALPISYKDLVGDYLWPLVQDMAASYKLRTEITPWIVGLQGTQGSGKSTVCLFIKTLLEECFDLNIVVLSIDDFYKTRQERIQLAKDIHPLFVTRGVPGTHDVRLAESTIQQLSELSENQACKIPSFNKAIDDRLEQSDWNEVKGSVDIILFEGWCMGVSAQSSAALKQPINDLEKKEDTECIWREYANENLKNQYKSLFEKIDNLIVLQAPSFKCVYQWRALQETKLHEKNIDVENTMVQTPKQVERFISHYERLTRFALMTLSEQASWVITLDTHHNMKSLHRNDSFIRVD